MRYTNLMRRQELCAAIWWRIFSESSHLQTYENVRITLRRISVKQIVRLDAEWSLVRAISNCVEPYGSTIREFLWPVCANSRFSSTRQLISHFWAIRLLYLTLLYHLLRFCRIDWINGVTEKAILTYFLLRFLNMACREQKYTVCKISLMQTCS
jgi:hypothetical protein